MVGEVHLDSGLGISPSHILTAHRRLNHPESAHLCSRHLFAIDAYGGVSKRLFGFQTICYILQVDDDVS